MSNYSKEINFIVGVILVVFAVVLVGAFVLDVIAEVQIGG